MSTGGNPTLHMAVPLISCVKRKAGHSFSKILLTIARTVLCKMPKVQGSCPPPPPPTYSYAVKGNLWLVQSYYVQCMGLYKPYKYPRQATRNAVETDISTLRQILK